MKITPKDYAAIRDAIRAYSERHPEVFSVMDSYRRYSLSRMRFRWDILRAAGVHLGSRTACSTPGTICVYDYANDDHVDTALRRIMRTVGYEWASRP